MNQQVARKQSPEPPGDTDGGVPAAVTVDGARLRHLVEHEYEFLARTLRRLGVAPRELEDAVQDVFLVAARKLVNVPVEHERGFLFGIMLRVASTRRRTVARRREDGEDALATQHAPLPNAEELVDQRQARELLDRILLEMELEFRTVFVLYELEGLQVVEIAALLAIPVGTVASRLRRARRLFQDAVKRYQARVTFRPERP